MFPDNEKNDARYTQSNPWTEEDVQDLTFGDVLMLRRYELWWHDYYSGRSFHMTDEMWNTQLEIMELPETDRCNN